MKNLTLAACIVLSSAAANAHSKMNATTPEDGMILESPPTEIALNFSDKLRLTKVEASHSSGDTQSIDLSDHNAFVNAFKLPIEPMGTGIYEIEWRGLGVDGHAMQGEFSFEVE